MFITNQIYLHVHHVATTVLSLALCCASSCNRQTVLSVSVSASERVCSDCALARVRLQKLIAEEAEVGALDFVDTE